MFDSERAAFLNPSFNLKKNAWTFKFQDIFHLNTRFELIRISIH